MGTGTLGVREKQLPINENAFVQPFIMRSTLWRYLGFSGIRSGTSGVGVKVARISASSGFGDEGGNFSQVDEGLQV